MRNLECAAATVQYIELVDVQCAQYGLEESASACVCLPAGILHQMSRKRCIVDVLSRTTTKSVLIDVDFHKERDERIVGKMVEVAVGRHRRDLP